MLKGDVRTIIVFSTVDFLQYLFYNFKEKDKQYPAETEGGGAYGHFECKSFYQQL